jgi:polysaccharide deacetylase 2 family uncharacterized protein YibQ
MPQLKDVDKKEEVARKIKELVTQINEQLPLANHLFIGVTFTQNQRAGSQNAGLCVFISETMVY